MEEKEEKRLSLLVRLSFGMGNMLNVLGVVGMWFPYASAFFTKVLHLTGSQAGTILLVAQVAGGVFAPLVGILSDMCKTPCYGRRKVFHLVGVLSFVCSFFFLWHNCFGCSGRDATLYYSLIAIIFQFGYAATQISQLALVPELAPNRHAKVELNSIRFAFQVGGTLLTFVILWVLLEELPCHGENALNATSAGNPPCGGSSNLDQGDQEAFWVSAIIVIGLGFLMVIPFHLVVREKNTALKKLKGYLWFIKPNFYLVICAFIAAKIITIFTQQFLPFYFLDTLNMTQTSVSVGPLVLYVASFVSTMSVKRINKFVGEKMLYFIGVCFVWGALIWFWIQPETTSVASFDWSRDKIYIAIILLGLGGATLMVLSLSLVSILIGEYSGSSALVYGWVLLIDRVSNGVLNKLVFELKDNFYKEEEEERRFYRHVIVFTPFAATALGLGAICLMALLEYFELKKSPSGYTTLNSSVQIRDAVADRASLYSFKGTKTCCSCFNSEEKVVADGVAQDSEQQNLMDNKQLEASSSSHKVVRDLDYEHSLTI